MTAFFCPGCSAATMNKDYAKFMRALYGTQDNRDGEQYQKLMAHEKDVLATVNRVANTRNSRLG